jgi:hypothetical protein
MVKKSTLQERRAVIPRCAYQKLYPAILMMKSAGDRPRGDVTEPLKGAAERRSEGEMRSDVAIVGGISGEDSAQMGFAKDDDMVEAFSADRADKPLRMPVLPR